MDEKELKNELLNTLLNFEIKQIPSETRFWMIRTKKGYFYNEFLTKKYVALAWNTITKDTNFSDATIETLQDHILVDYPEIKRPTLVINKCKSFIQEIKPGDILVIPSNGSQYITFAYAGEYYEEDSKTPELESAVTYRIENREVVINEVSCPYKKRRHIEPIRTVKSDIINYHLLRGISSYHGISNFDDYAEIILDHIYNCYSYNDNTRLVFHVGKTDPITSREFSGFLYSINSILSSTGIDEKAISTQASVHSVGDIVFTIRELYTFLSDHYIILIAFVVVVGGGKFLTVELPGVVNIIKNILSIATDKRKAAAEARSIELDNQQKELEILSKMQSLGISDFSEIEADINRLASCSQSMQIQPLSNITEPLISSIPTIDETDDEESTS